MTTPAERLKAVFDQAAEIAPPADRAAFLDEACVGNADLRARVEALLRAYAEAGSFLEYPAVGPSATATFEPGGAAETTLQCPPEPVGAMIGSYKLLQQIGEGGMGTVFMAEQTQPVQRKVALKVIKPGMDSRQVIARFEAERQALAMMDHVNIARVFDAGATENGRPYFVMELVHGVPITKYCDDNHLAPRQRLELFVPVCQAIQHAHQKGIIHRDIKPTNVMITLYDGKPVPKVIDFGVAKATEQKLTARTLFTQYGAMVGTLEYMSPEQAEMSALGVDTRSDIFSLGVLLYELLTGSTPLSHKRLKDAAYAEILRMIKEEEPQKPSTRLSDSGEALASISAQRHMEPAKLSKLMRGELDWIVMKTLEKDRNRRYETANAFAADVQRYLNDETVQACPPSAAYRFRKFTRRNKRALVTVAVLGLAVLVVAGTLGWAFRDREAHAQDAARDRAAREVAIEAEVNTALQEAERWQEQEKWAEALSAVKRAEGLLAGGGSNELRERVRQFRKDLEMVLRLEDISLLSSDTSEGKFDHQTADRAYARAFADYGIDVAALPPEEAAARVRARAGVTIALAAAMDYWAFSRGQTDRAGRLALTAVAQSADPNLWRRQVREAIPRKDGKALVALATSPQLVRQPPSSLLLLSRALFSCGQVEAQIEVLRQAQRQYPGDFWINYSLAYALSTLGSSYRDEVLSFARAAVAVRPRSAAAHNLLGNALRDQKKLDEAVACYRKAIELDPKYTPAYFNLGNALRDQKKLDEAVACYRRAIELAPKAAGASGNLGLALADQGKLDEAVACHRKAIELEPTVARNHYNLGVAFQNQKKLDEAISAYRKAIELDQQYAPPYVNLGSVLWLQGKLDEAIAYYRKAGELLPADADVHASLGSVLWVRGKLVEAVACSQKAADCSRKAIELDPKNARAHAGLGDALRRQGKRDEAVACYKRAIELDPKNPDVHYALGNVLIDLKSLDEAIACFRKVIELDPKRAGAYHALGNILQNQRKLDEAFGCHTKAVALDPENATFLLGLADVLRLQGKHDEALAGYRKAIDLDPKIVGTDGALGLALLNEMKQAEVISRDRSAIELDPKNAQVHVEPSTNLDDQKKLDEVIASYKKAIELDPMNADDRVGLGVALRKRGELDEAIASYKRAIDLGPKNLAAHNNLGNALRRQGKRDEALAYLDKAVKLDPSSDAPWFNRGLVYLDLKQHDKALADFAKAIELKPDHAQAWGFRHQVYMNLQKYDQAVADCSKAIARQPDSALAWYYRGSVRGHLGQHDKAIPDYSEAIKLKPDSPSAFYARARAYESLMKWDQALADYTQTIKLKPDSHSAFSGRGRIHGVLDQADKSIAEYSEAIKLKPDDRMAFGGRSRAYRRLKQWDKCIADKTKMLELLPSSHGYNELAWFLVNCPDPKFRDATRAIELAKRALELSSSSESGAYWNTLGAAYYRAENWKQALGALDTSMHFRKGGDSHDWFFMAMAHWRLGNKDEARKWYAQAIAWMDKNQPTNEELRHFRLEASELLDVGHALEVAPYPRPKP